MAGSKIFQIVGFQNSGKTTLMEKVIFSGTNIGLRIGTIKHHGHGGKPEKVRLDKDTNKHQIAGALITAVEGDGSLLIEANKQSWSLEEIVNSYQSFSLDLILIEGYKDAAYPKVVLIRDEADLFLLEKLDNIKAVISWIAIESKNVYTIESMDQFVQVFFSEIYEGLG